MQLCNEDVKLYSLGYISLCVDCRCDLISDYRYLYGFYCTLAVCKHCM